MTDDNISSQCSNAECEVLLTGTCAKGHALLAECPLYRLSAADPSDSDASIDELSGLNAKGTVAYLPLASGLPLTPQDVSDFLCWRAAKLITIIGERDSGKSTLICAIYDRFLHGPFADHIFCSSRTLVGLELRSHYSRIESGGVIPETQRTAVSEGLKYFHFALAPADSCKSRVDLLVSDRAGEIYRLARGDSQLVLGLDEVKTADSVVILLDGARVADPANRAGAMQSVRQTLRAFLDGNALGSGSSVQVVLTKLDALRRALSDTEIDALFVPYENMIRTDFAPRIRDLSFWRISARDPQNPLSPAVGVDLLLKKWLKTSAPTQPVPPEFLPLTTEFDRLSARLQLEVKA